MEVILRFLRSTPDLARWEEREFMAASGRGPANRDRRAALERVVAREAPGDPEPGGAYCRLATAVLGYHIFPPSLVMRVLRRAPLRAGDTVGTCYHFLPGIDLFFASRVTACFDERVGNSWCCGFTYRTLTGHPLIGEETFSVEKDAATGCVKALLRSWSRPGIWLAHLGKPIVRWLQFRAGRAALDHLQAIITVRASGSRSSNWL